MSNDGQGENEVMKERRGPGRPRKLDPVAELLEQNRKLMETLVGSQEEQRKRTATLGPKPWNPPEDYGDPKKFEHIDPRAEMEKLAAKYQHRLGPTFVHTGDPERIPPLPIVENEWGARCVSCGLSITFRWNGRPGNDPESSNPAADPIVTGYTIYGAAQDTYCGQAIRDAKAGKAKEIRPNDMRPVFGEG